MTLQEAVARAIAKMRFAGLSDYGRLPNDAAHMALVIETYWEALLEEPGSPRAIGPDEVAEATGRFVRGGGDFPSAGRFREECLAVWERNWRLAGIETEDGYLAMVAVPRRDPERADRIIAARRAGLPRALPADTSPLREGRPSMPEPKAVPA